MNAPVLIMAGGTGGHIVPGLATAHELRQRDVPVVWLGSRGGLETRMVPAAAIPLETIQISGIRGRGVLAKLLAPFLLLRAVAQAISILRRLRPRAVLSMGGFAAGPGGVAAWLLQRPLLVHEQNCIPGITNRVLARLARRLLCGFPGAFPEAMGAVVVGNPVRGEIVALAAPDVRGAGHGVPLRLLVLGGSQGARALNQTVPRALGGLCGVAVRHQCGQRFVEETRKSYAEAGIDAAVEPFIDDMATALADADLVICRAGALTLAELAAAGCASLLVPFPHAVDDHQTRNADWLVAAGAAERYAESATLAERLRSAVSRLKGDREMLADMAQRARSLALPDAARRVAEACLEEARA